jgi:hypothetical protein
MHETGRLRIRALRVVTPVSDGMRDAQHIRVTFFANYAATTKREVVLSRAALGERLRITTADDKGSLPWLKCARFGEQRSEHNSLRHNANVIAITGVEADYDGEQMGFDDAVRIVTTAGLCAIIYTSPSHTEAKPRWRVLCFCSREYPPTERARFLARLNGPFGGIFSHESWTLSQSYYFGSVRRNPAHRVVVIEGTCIDLRNDLDAGAIRPALQDAQASLRAARLMRASEPRRRDGNDDSLIERIRARLDLGAVLAAHGYARRGNDYRHPNSQSGSFGLNVATFGGIERVYSHNGGDPLHPGNLPAWTAGVTAVDVVDAVTILDFGGDRTRALRELSLRFGLVDEARRTPPFARLWEASAPLGLTSGATWLEAIGLGYLIGCRDLRFSADCPHPTGVRLPALIAAVRTLDGTLTGVYRVYLASDGTKPAGVDPQRAALGSVMGGAIRLAPIESVLTAGELVVGVDIEEAASLAALLRRPAWAAGTPANLAAGIVLLPEVRRAAIIATPGDRAARSAWFRFKREGRQVQIATPPPTAASYSEILQNKNAGRDAA